MNQRLNFDLLPISSRSRCDPNVCPAVARMAIGEPKPFTLGAELRLIWHNRLVRQLNKDCRAPPYSRSTLWIGQTTLESPPSRQPASPVPPPAPQAWGRFSLLSAKIPANLPTSSIARPPVPRNRTDGLNHRPLRQVLELAPVDRARRSPARSTFAAARPAGNGGLRHQGVAAGGRHRNPARRNPSRKCWTSRSGPIGH